MSNSALFYFKVIHTMKKDVKGFSSRVMNSHHAASYGYPPTIVLEKTT